MFGSGLPTVVAESSVETRHGIATPQHTLHTLEAKQPVRPHVASPSEPPIPM